MKILTLAIFENNDEYSTDWATFACDEQESIEDKQNLLASYFEELGYEPMTAMKMAKTANFYDITEVDGYRVSLSGKDYTHDWDNYGKCCSCGKWDLEHPIS